MNEDELIGLLRERQNNGRTGYLTFGDLVAMVPSDQIDEWRAVLAKAKAADAVAALAQMLLGQEKQIKTSKFSLPFAGKLLRKK